MDTWLTLGLIAILLGLVWFTMHGFRMITMKPDRRKVDYLAVYNEQEDRTETMFDQRTDTNLK